MLKKFLIALTLGCLSAAALQAAEPAGEWHFYRGPSRDGVIKEGIGWPAGGPKQVWKAKIGEGYSSMSVSNGKVYATGNDGTQDTVWCLDGETGNVVWQQSYPCGTDKGYPGPRATPTIDGDKVYTFSRKGQLNCYDAAKGTPVWSTQVAKEAGGKAPGWDFASSPFISGNVLYLSVGTNGCAVDKTSGKVLWKSGADAAGYAVPVPYDIGGGKFALAIFNGNALNGVNAETGAVQWTLPWTTKYGVNSIDPLFIGNKAFLTSDYDYGCALIQVDGTAVKTLWQNKSISCHTSNPVHIKGFVYGFDGNQGSPGSLKCVDLSNGAVKWTKGPFMGTLLTDGSKLLILNVKGELIVAEADSSAYKELARAQILGGQCWTLPVLTNGKLYARNTGGDLVCFSLK